MKKLFLLFSTSSLNATSIISLNSYTNYEDSETVSPFYGQRH